MESDILAALVPTDKGSLTKSDDDTYTATFTQGEETITRVFPMPGPAINWLARTGAGMLNPGQGLKNLRGHEKQAAEARLGPKARSIS